MAGRSFGRSWFTLRLVQTVTTVVWHTVVVKTIQQLALVVVLTTLAACGGGGADEAESTSADSTTTVAVAPTTTAATTNAVVPAGYSTISSDDGRTRTYKVVDLSNGEDDVPMVLVVHGFGGSAEAMSAYTG
ncbi:MAG: hypothetical protein EBZ88_05805, partial [Actinobacteria bacterium]|nr:hypothetical protein [Actinomycetota bacterium]